MHSSTRILGVMAMAMAMAMAACGSQPVDRSQPASASAEPSETAEAAGGWQEPAGYTFVLDSRCGERSLIGRFAVEVENHVVVSVEGLDQQAKQVAAFIEPEVVPTLGDIMDTVARARSEEAFEVLFQADPVDGHPVMASINWELNTIDEEECYRISDFVAAED